MKNILILCVGNICRSPMAEGIFSSELPNLTVTSAGTGALIGHPADKIAVELMRLREIDISRHVARQVGQLMSRQADLILVMDSLQRRTMETQYPFVRGKVFRIAESINQEIPDPYRKSEKVFEQVLSLIEEGSASWIERIKKITQERQCI